MKYLRHSALIAIISSWLGGAWLLIRQSPDIHDAISQYSLYGRTWMIFGLVLSIVAVCLMFFGGYLKKYWEFAPKLMLFAGTFYLITAWTPYGQSSLPNWAHNISFYLGTFCLTMTLWQCTAKLNHRLSRALLLTTIAASASAGIAVLAKQWSFHIELGLMIVAQVWILLLAYLPAVLSIKQKLSKSYARRSLPS